MTSVDRYTVHMTILSPIGRSIFTCFRFRYRFHLWEDFLRESLNLYNDFVGFLVVLSFFYFLLLLFFLESFWLFLFEQVSVLGRFFFWVYSIL